MTYDKTHFIAKFSAIPEALWCTELLHSGDACCVLGHCHNGDERRGPTGECAALIRLFQPAHDFRVFESVIADINDGKDDRYGQSTPKARVLAALADLP